MTPERFLARAEELSRLTGTSYDDAFHSLAASLSEPDLDRLAEEFMQRTPRTKDGKPNLTAPPPRVNGNPDLSGVWHVEPTSLAEMKQLFGPNVDTLDVPGMEADTISKYAVNILLDFKPDDVPMRPQTAAMLQTSKGYVGSCNAPLFL
jgi:hypothetical protein